MANYKFSYSVLKNAALPSSHCFVEKGSSHSVRPDSSSGSLVNAALSSHSVRPELVEGYERDIFKYFIVRSLRQAPRLRVKLRRAWQGERWLKSLAILLLILSFWSLHSAIITHDPNRAGRTGDKFLQFTKALWLAEQMGVPFKFSPFANSELMHLAESNQVAELPKNMAAVAEIRAKEQVKKESNSLYQISYYYKDAQWGHWLEICSWHGLFDNPKFMEKLRHLARPRFELPALDLPNDRLCVAVHIRKGDGGDHPLFSERKTRSAYADKLWPIKFPPDDYYIAQIKHMYALLGSQPTHVHIFTDARNTNRLIEKYKGALKGLNITFSARIDGNNGAANIIEDLHQMTRFAYFIRGGSNFAQMAHLVGDFKMVIYPKSARWQGDRMVLDVAIISQNRRLQGESLYFRAG